MTEPLDGMHTTLVNLLRALRKRWVLVAGLTVGVMALVGVGSALSTPYYAATATVQISPEAPNVMDFGEVSEVGAGSSWARRFETYYQTQYRVIESRTVLDEAARRLVEDHGVDDFDGVSDRTLFLQRHLTIAPAHDTHLVQLTVEYPNAERAALFVNTIAESYRDHNLAEALEASRSAVEWLEEQQASYREQKLASDARIVQFQSQHDLLGGEGTMPPGLSNLQRLQENLSEVRTHRIRLEGRLLELRALADGSRWTALAAHLSTSDDVVAQRVLALDELLAQRRELLGRYTPAHPKVKALSTAIESTESHLREILAAHIQGRRAEIEVVRREEATLIQAIDAARDEVSALGSDLIELRLLEAEAERNEAFFRSLDRRLTEVGLSSVMVANNVSVLDSALPVHTPVRPRILLNVLAAGFLGFLGAAVLVLVLETFDQSVRGASDVQEKMGLPFLGFVPRVAADEIQRIQKTTGRSTVAHSLPRSPVAESLRGLRTTLQLHRRHSQVRSVLLTSTLPLEGKSFVSTNLSSIVAMSGERVLLIDADLRRPTIHKLFGCEPSQGLGEVLAGRCDPREAIHRSHVPNLDVLFAGLERERPAEMLDAARVEELLSRLASDYDLIIVDSSPAGVVADAFVWASVTDTAVMVTEIGRPRLSLAVWTAERLLAVNRNTMGVVLNKAELGARGERYGYSYQYVPREDNEVQRESA